MNIDPGHRQRPRDIQETIEALFIHQQVGPLRSTPQLIDRVRTIQFHSNDFIVSAAYPGQRFPVHLDTVNAGAWPNDLQDLLGKTNLRISLGDHQRLDPGEVKWKRHDEQRHQRPGRPPNETARFDMTHDGRCDRERQERVHGQQVVIALLGHASKDQKYRRRHRE